MDNLYKSMPRYDKDRLTEIRRWKAPDTGGWASLKATATKPFNAVADMAMDNAVGEAIGNAVTGIISMINDAMSWSVDTDAILKEFRVNGYHSVYNIKDIHALSLKTVDEVIGYLAAKYKLQASIEGAVAGYVGLPGIVVDVPALLALNLRAIGEYATYYGFSISTEAERQFAMNILMLDSSPNQHVKSVTFSQLHRIALGVTRKKTWKELEKNLLVRGVQQIAKTLGVRLTKAKLAQVVPFIGAGVGAGYNAWYTAVTCESARYLYQERFLAEKYGAGILD